MRRSSRNILTTSHTSLMKVSLQAASACFCMRLILSKIYLCTFLIYLSSSAGILHLIHCVDKAVVLVVGEVSLTKEITYEELIDLLNCVRRKVEMKKSNGYHDSYLVNMTKFMFRNGEQLDDINEDFIHIDKNDAVVGVSDNKSVRGGESVDCELACAYIRNNLLQLINRLVFMRLFQWHVETTDSKF